MFVRALVLGFAAVYSVLADQYVSLELNVLDDPAVVSSELDFVNSRVLTHDVNPGYYVEKVTHSGLLVWKSMKAGHRATNALLFVNEHGPRLINLTVGVGDGQSQLLMFLYTLQGWVNLNDVNPFNIKLEVPESDSKEASPLNLSNGEQYFNKDPLDKEEQYSDEPVVLDLDETVNSKFNYTFKYSMAKYTYDYKPKQGYYVNEIKEGNKKIWYKKKDHLVTEIVVDKQSDVFVSVHVYYLSSEKPKSTLYIKEDGEWKLAPTNFDEAEEKGVGKSVNKESVALGEFLKPVIRSTKFDYTEIPQPPLCRRCTYEVDGITHNVLYFSRDSKYHTFVDGSLPLVDLPNDCMAMSSCFYTKNDKTLFVDLVYKKDNETHSMYFEKEEQGYRKVTRNEFDSRLLKFKETPVVLDISRERAGYTVETTVKDEIENKFYKPSEGYVVRTVMDGDMKILDLSSYVVEVSVTNLGGDKRLMLILYQNGSFFAYNYYTFYPELGKWTRVSDYFYYKMIEEFSQNLKSRYPTLDIRNLTTVRKFMHFSKNDALSHYTFNPRTGVVLSSVLDAGRMVWTPRYPNETCEFVLYNYKAQLLYLVSRADTKVRHYFYEKTGEKWSSINEEGFKKRFSFAYSTNLTADIRNDFSNKFTVEESGDMFYITPKSGYLVNRVRYKDKTIWMGSDSLKCTSFYLMYGTYDTYLYLNLLDSSMNTSTKYFKTTGGDFFKWRECGVSDSRDEPADPLTNDSFNLKSHSESKKSETEGKDVPPVTRLSHLEGKLAGETKVNDNVTNPADKGTTKETTKEKAGETKESLTTKAPTGAKYTSKLKDKEALASENERQGVGKVSPADYMVTKSIEEMLESEVEDEKPAGTLNLNEEVLKNKVPGSFEYITGKELSFPPLRYEERLALTNEPHNKNEELDASAELSKKLALLKLTNEEGSADEPSKNTKGKPESDSAKFETESKVAEEPEFNVVDSKADLSTANNVYNLDNSKANNTDRSNFSIYNIDFSKRPATTKAPKVNVASDLNSSEHLTKLGNFKSVEGMNGKNAFHNGVLYLQDLKYAKFGEYRDARDFGYDYLLFTPYPKHPVTELRDAYEVIWKSHSEQCLAVSVHLRAGFQTMVELFIKTGTEVVRRHFEFSGYRWLPMESDKYDRVCMLDATSEGN